MIDIKKINIDFKNKQIMLLAVLVGIAVLYVYANFILIAQARDTFRTYKNSRKAHREVISAERDIAKVEDLKNQVLQYRSKIDSYERMLPAEQEVPGLLENLSLMAKKSGVKIVGITPVSSKESPSAGQIYHEIPILISAKSGYHELGRFLSDLEGADRFMKVVDIQIKANRTSPKKHDVELLVMTYILPKNG